MTHIEHAVLESTLCCLHTEVDLLVLALILGLAGAFPLAIDHV